jgi:hypothetical protein
MSRTRWGTRIGIWQEIGYDQATQNANIGIGGFVYGDDEFGVGLRYDGSGYF